MKAAKREREREREKERRDEKKNYHKRDVMSAAILHVREMNWAAHGPRTPFKLVHQKANTNREMIHKKKEKEMYICIYIMKSNDNRDETPRANGGNQRRFDCCLFVIEMGAH